ncbi:uncharacterized protein [Amphiura filiformis]|uniref:uncharacterized protein n=1 Tax=Amphiura filiformis TaxID=82378 RepID=UPI003B20C3CB
MAHSFIQFTFLCWLSILLQTDKISSATMEDVESHIVQSHTTNKGESVVILDHLFPKSSLEALHTLILLNSPWQLHNEQEFPSLTSQKSPPGKGDLDVSNEDDCSKEVFPWSVPIPSAVFTKFNIWKLMHSSLKHVTEKDDYQPYEITAQVLQRGDKINTTCGLEKSSGEDQTVRIFLTPDWGQNDYGDLTLFKSDDDHSDVDSVILNVKPRFGRAVIWDAHIPYLSHSPSMSYVQELMFLTIRCTRDKEKVQVTQKEIGSKLVEQENSRFFRFPKFKKKPNTKQLSEKEVRRFHDKDGRVVVVFDNIFSSDDVHNLKMYAAHQGPNFGWGPYDTAIAEGGDNVKWIKIFEPEDFRHTQWWTVIADLAKYVSGKKSEWYPYNVALNVGKPTDHTRIHPDCEIWEDEYTFLMYLNSNWSAEKLGETTFFDVLPDNGSLKEELTEEEIYQLSEYDAIGAVRPQLGRVVVFQGTIPHSARPPSSSYHGMRFSFAVKVAATKQIALAKRLREAIEDFPVEKTDDEALLIEELYDSSIKKKIGRSEKWLMEELNNYIIKQEDFIESEVTKAKNHLMRN